jgi:hypothetical protein
MSLLRLPSVSCWAHSQDVLSHRLDHVAAAAAAAQRSALTPTVRSSSRALLAAAEKVAAETLREASDRAGDESVRRRLVESGAQLALALELEVAAELLPSVLPPS